MLEGTFYEHAVTFPTIRAYPVSPQETSGVTMGSQSIYRYALRESDYPTLSIAEPVYDNLGNVILPGHYELALADDRNFLILIQSKQPVAVIPVYQVQEDKTEVEKLYNKKYQRKKKKEKKERDKVNKKRDKVGMPHDEEYIHMEASIEYNAKGKYYILKYERGTIRAWGAIKG